MRKISIQAVNIGAALLGFTFSAAASEVISWDFRAYGGFAKIHVGDFPNPGYEALLTQLPPRSHQDMGAFYWGELPMPRPSLLGINQKEPLIHGLSWKAPGRYYGEKNPIQPGVISMHGEPIGPIVTNTDNGQVIGWATHYNHWIPDDFEGARVAVNYHLQLFDPDADAPPFDTGEMFFFIDVWETTNRPADNEENCCPDGNLVDTGRNINGCADRFRVGVLRDNYPSGDPGGDGVVDVKDLENAPTPGACFDELVYSFPYQDLTYNVYLTGFWEAGDLMPVGEGWSPEEEFIHFEVRAEVWVEAERPSHETPKCSIGRNEASCVMPLHN